jgi:hypothetical protein
MRNSKSGYWLLAKAAAAGTLRKEVHEIQIHAPLLFFLMCAELVLNI